MRKHEKQFRELRDQLLKNDPPAIDSEYIKLSNNDLRDLAARELIKLTNAGNNTFHIELASRVYYYLDDVVDRRKEKTIEWLRYAITTAIAVAALIISIF